MPKLSLYYGNLWCNHWHSYIIAAMYAVFSLWLRHSFIGLPDTFRHLHCNTLGNGINQSRRLRNSESSRGQYIFARVLVLWGPRY